MLKAITLRRVAAGVVFSVLTLSAALSSSAQSGATRPRRTTPTQTAPAPSSTAPANESPAAPAQTQTPARSNTASAANKAPAAAGTTDTTRAYSLLQQKQFDAAAKEASQIAAKDPKNSEAWKIAGFAKLSLKQYEEAAGDLQKAYDLQRTAKEDDAPTVDALAQAYMRSEKYDQALPFLTAVTTRAGAKPDPLMLYYRGYAEYQTKKFTEAERSFNEAIKADPKNSAALFYLGRIAYDRKDDAAAINALNRATVSDPRLAEAWSYLTYSYLRRAEAEGGTGAKADADYQGAVRSSEGLLKVRSDEPATTLHAQALVRAQQYARAATALERVAANPNAQGSTLYLLGFSHARAKNFPKAVAALERAAAKSPDDANVFRELGYAHEASKQYAKALAAYEKGLSLAPTDEYFKESVERVKPFAK